MGDPGIFPLNQFFPTLEFCLKWYVKHDCGNIYKVNICVTIINYRTSLPSCLDQKCGCINVAIYHLECPARGESAESAVGGVSQPLSVLLSVVTQ